MHRLVDTSPDMERFLVEGFRKMSPERKLRRVAKLNESLRSLARIRIRAQRGDDLPERELRLRLASLHLDRDTMLKVFAWDPEIEGY